MAYKLNLTLTQSLRASPFRCSEHHVTRATPLDLHHNLHLLTSKHNHTHKNLHTHLTDVWCFTHQALMMQLINSTYHQPTNHDATLSFTFILKTETVTYSASLQVEKLCSVFRFPVCKSTLVVSFGVSQRSVQTQPADSAEMVATSSRPTVNQAHSFSNMKPLRNHTLIIPLPHPSAPTLTKKHSSVSDWLKSLTPQDSSLQNWACLAFERRSF